MYFVFYNMQVIDHLHLGSPVIVCCCDTQDTWPGPLHKSCPYRSWHLSPSAQHRLQHEHVTSRAPVLELKRQSAEIGMLIEHKPLGMVPVK